MSYTKAMRHSLKKSKKQKNMHFGFDTSDGTHQRAAASYPNIECLMNISRWFKWRHIDGLRATREAIREQVIIYRGLNKLSK